MTTREISYNNAKQKIARHLQLNSLPTATEGIQFFLIAQGYIDELLAQSTLDKYDEKIMQVLNKRIGKLTLLCQIHNYFQSKKNPVTSEFVQERLDRLYGKGKIGSMTRVNSKGKTNTYYFIKNYFGEGDNRNV